MTEKIFTDREIWIIQNWIREELSVNPDLEELSVIHKKLEELK